jgi:hypothetical protein
MQRASGDTAMRSAHDFVWFYHSKHDESDEHFGCPLNSRYYELVVSVHKLVQKDRRLSSHEMAGEVKILDSCQDILARDSGMRYISVRFLP